MDLDKLKLLFDNDGVHMYQARMVRTLRDTGDPNLKQIAMGVIGISKDDKNDTPDGWERLDCDIIVIPRKRYVAAHDNGLDKMRIDQAMQYLSDDDKWKVKK